MKNRNLLFATLVFFSSSLGNTFAASSGTFNVVSENAKAAICIDAGESSVVKKSAGMFCSDVEEITKQKLPVLSKIRSSGAAIVAGTLGQSKLIRSIIKKYHLSTDSLTGRWEAFSIQLVERKEGNLLVVLGSDKRGTAYGILELSRRAGISPWIWWADVKPAQRKELTLSVSQPILQQPSVQYRGIFLNDEDWGLKPWASKTFDPAVGEIGPKTYRKIFELLLRLRANTIWPAMHECTTPFYFVKGNAAMADSFGIVVSTSHCEPLMRSNPLEWNHDTNGAYNFFTNKDKVVEYWSERLKEVSNYENVYTVGMRGIHDGAMEGAKTVPKQIEGLTDVFKEQRSLLTKYLRKDETSIPQIFIPYKEVLDAYNGGLKVPDDVTLLWCDDNYGYLTRLSNKEEQQRKGGSGVYYHLSYWGRPHDYLWLGTTQPAFIWQEMQKAWAYGARKMWILNVGDIKPSEYLTEFYLDMAWDIHAVKADRIADHLENWMGKTFGPGQAASLKDLMNEYYRLSFIRKPEFMAWTQTEPTTKIKELGLNFTERGDELLNRLQQHASIETRAQDLESQIPARLRNAYYELIKYPVSGASEMNRKWINWQYATLFARYQLPEAASAAQKSVSAWEKIQQMTRFYNDSLENGKWKWMMSAQPRKLPVFDKPVFPELTVTTQKETLFWPEGSSHPMTKGDTVALAIDNAAKGIYCFNGRSYRIVSQPDWLLAESLEASAYDGLPAEKLLLSLIPEKMKSKTAKGMMVLQSGNNRFYLNIVAGQSASAQQLDHLISLRASDFSENKKSASAQWQNIDGLGYSQSSMLLQPFDAKLSADVTQNPSLGYEFTSQNEDSAQIRICLLPTHAVDGGKNVRIAVSFDGADAVVYNIHTEGRSSAWKENVLRNQAIVKIPVALKSDGKHILRIFAVDTDVAIDQVTIDFKIGRQFYGI